MSQRFDDTLTMGISLNLRSFAIEYILGKWSALTNKGEASAYLQTASTHLEEAKRKIYHRSKPQRARP